MARPDRRFATAVGVGALTMSASCTVFDGLSVPPLDSGVQSGRRPCDATRVATDAHNCGACGHDCLGGSCASGACQPVVLATASGSPTDLAIDDTYVFWSTDDGTVSTLGRVKKDGSDPHAIVSGIASGVARIALGSSRVYFTNSRSNVLYAVTKDGTAQTAVATGQPGATPIASDCTAVYWATNHGSGMGDWIARAAFAPDGGATWTELWQGRQFPREIAVDSASVYWGENYQTILQAAKNGTGAPIVLTDCASFGAIALDDTFVYWTTTTGQVRRTAKGEPVDPANGCDAPSARTLAQEDGGVGVLGLALGANTLVYAERVAGALKAIPTTGACTTGSCARVLAASQANPTRVVADGQAAYWINTGDHSVMKVAF